MNHPKKLLFVIDNFGNPFAGTESQLFQLIKNLDRTRYDPQLLVFTDSDYLIKQGFPCSYSVLGVRSLSHPWMWVKLYRFARQFYSDGGRLAHVYFNDASVICPPIFSMAGIKTIISRRDMGFWYTSFYRRVLSITQRWVDHVVVNSEAVKTVTAAAENIDSERISVIYNGFAEPRGDSRDVDFAVEALKSSGDILLLGLVANIRPIKRMQDAIDALASLGKEYTHVLLVIVGAGDQSELSARTESCGVGGQVFFLGGRSNVTACLAGFDVGLLCSESEGFSNAIVEYMRAGLPTICSNVGGNGEAITHSKTGFLYPAGDVQTLAGLIKQLADNESLRMSMALEAKKQATERFAMQRMIDEHMDLYGELLSV